MEFMPFEQRYVKDHILRNDIQLIFSAVLIMGTIVYSVSRILSIMIRTLTYGDAYFQDMF